MAWQCLNWASVQNIPNRSKALLIILANHANGETGHCFPSIELLMKECSYSRSAIYGFLGMLKRNGYISVRKAKGCGRAADIWLNMDRVDAPWITPKTKTSEPEDIQDVDASPESGLENDAAESNPWTGGVQSLDENGGDTLYGEPSYIEPRAGARNEIAPAGPDEPQALEVVAKGYDPTKRDRELERLQAAEKAREPKSYPIIYGTRWWERLIASGHPPTLVCGIVDARGKPHRGWNVSPEKFKAMMSATGPPVRETADVCEDEDMQDVEG